eukprot:TRINITY_DN42220_c0_g1_i1.p1 TRINITY_DN42220_c0_g1~~TRINITY_DN42220_c0_g1_i1.p1  ORF type:complete len:570 (-),score=145.27 TRINITY_DN42220_c0_g1_i1:109-1752(-)
MEAIVDTTDGQSAAKSQSRCSRGKQTGVDLDSAAAELERNGLLNCHFSVNQPALYGLLRPMISDMVEEAQQSRRLKSMEDAVANFKLVLDQKADAASLAATTDAVRQHQQVLQQRADLRAFVDLQSCVNRHGETLAGKANQLALDEVVADVRRCMQAAASKADLTYVNKTNTLVQKLTERVARIERQSADNTAFISELDAHKVPAVLARTREHLTKTASGLSKLQEVVAGKADQCVVDQLTSLTQDVQSALARAASQQSLSDLQHSVLEMQRAVALKADLLAFNEHRQELQQLSMQFAGKGDVHRVREAFCLATDVQQHLTEKADQRYVDEMKSRLVNLEMLVAAKAERREMGEMRCAMEALKDDTRGACTAEQKAVAELSRQMQDLQAKCLQKVQTAEARLQALTQTLQHSQDASPQRQLELEEVAARLCEVENLAKAALEELQLKADQGSLQETIANVRALAEEIHCSSRFSSATSHASTAAPLGAKAAYSGGATAPTCMRSLTPRGASVGQSKGAQSVMARFTAKPPSNSSALGQARSPRGLRT